MANGMKSGGYDPNKPLPDATIPALQKGGGGASTVPTGPAVSPRPRTMGGVATTAPTTPPTGTTTGSKSTAQTIIDDLRKLQISDAESDAQDQMLMDYLNRETTSPDKKDPMVFKPGGTANKKDMELPKK
tara:strand:+ start:2561 stop:2950 length:390 start_codon:yes stop_codon:yes gene_type:complete